VIRDAMLLRPGGTASGAGPYLPVFALEAGLLALALIAAWPLLRRNVDSGRATASFDQQGKATSQEELAGTKA
jgi:hypothetical protein